MNLQMCTSKIQLGEWKFSDEVESEINQFLTEFPLKKDENEYNSLLEIIDKISRNESLIVHDVTMKDLTVNLEESDIACMIQAAETNNLEELLKLESLECRQCENLFTSLVTHLSQNGFVNVCRAACNFDFNETYMRTFCEHFILPKLIEREEVPQMIISALQGLAVRYPSEICCHVLEPLIFTIKEGYTFSDTELLSTIFTTLKSTHKDMFLSNLVEDYTNWKEPHWTLLQKLIPDFTTTSFNYIISLMYKLYKEYVKSKPFASFLVCLCKNLKPGLSDKYIDMLQDIAQSNGTLLKRQALKELEGYQNR